jgi:hypothetical protein
MVDGISPMRAELVLLQLNQETNDLKNKIMSLPEAQLKRETEAADRLTQEEIQKVLEAAQASQSAGVWSALSQVGACVLALFNIVAGGVFVTTGNDMVAGAALIASGFLTLGNLAITEKGWNWMVEFLAGENEEKKERLLVMLPIIVSLMSLLLGAAGYHKSQMMEAETILAALNQLSMLAAGGVTLGKAFSDIQVTRAKNNVTDVEKNLFINERDRDLIHRSIESLMRLFQQMSDEIKKSAREAISLATHITQVRV